MATRGSWVSGMLESGGRAARSQLQKQKGRGAGSLQPGVKNRVSGFRPSNEERERERKGPQACRRIRQRRRTIKRRRRKEEIERERETERARVEWREKQERREGERAREMRAQEYK